MKQLNPYRFYTWGHSLHFCADLSTTQVKLKEVLWSLYMAKQNAADIATQSVLPLALSPGVATELWRSLLAVIPEDFGSIDADRDVTPVELWTIKNAASKFETIFAAELQNASAYGVMKKGIYDTGDLIERADRALGDAGTVIVDEAKRDFNAAGRCLAFELPTACGFHTMRAVESVLRQYHRLLMALPASKRSPEMATCIDQLVKAGEDIKVMESLDHIRGMHRNPLMHPEDFLTMDDALRLFDIAKSAISSMAARIAEINGNPLLITAAKAHYSAAPVAKKKRGH